MVNQKDKKDSRFKIDAHFHGEFALIKYLNGRDCSCILEIQIRERIQQGKKCSLLDKALFWRLLLPSKVVEDRPLVVWTGVFPLSLGFKTNDKGMATSQHYKPFSTNWFLWILSLNFRLQLESDNQIISRQHCAWLSLLSMKKNFDER